MHRAQFLRALHPGCPTHACILYQSMLKTSSGAMNGHPLSRANWIPEAPHPCSYHSQEHTRERQTVLILSHRTVLPALSWNPGRIHRHRQSRSGMPSRLVNRDMRETNLDQNPHYPYFQWPIHFGCLLITCWFDSGIESFETSLWRAIFTTRPQKTLSLFLRNRVSFWGCHSLSEAQRRKPTCKISEL